MTCLLLHLSDIHIKNENDEILSKAESISSTTYEYLPSAKALIIVITGDIAFSGKPQEYLLAKKLIEEIKTCIQLESPNYPIHIVSCPGNHDCNFDLETSVRKTLLSQMTQEIAENVDEEYIKQLTAVQNPFFDFREALESRPIQDDKLWRVSEISLDNKTITFNTLNVAWMSKLNEPQASIFFPISRYQEKRTSDFIITLMHHPLNWFEQAAYRRFRAMLRNSSDLILSGHEHIGNTGILEQTETSGFTFVEGAALQDGNGLNNSSFNLIKLDLETEQFCSIKYKWNGEIYSPSDKESWREWRRIPVTNNKEFNNIELEFQKIIDDPGAYFKHPNTDQLTLSDIYTYPDLRDIKNSTQSKKEFINAKKLVTKKEYEESLLIRGEEKTGKTSLLYQYFKHYHENGIVPLYINAKTIKKDSETSIQSLIESAVSKQYGASHIIHYNQLPKSKKILLLDDFDDGQIRNEDNKANLITIFESKFHKLIVCVSDMFELNEILESSQNNKIHSYAHFEIQEFGYQRRADLIQRWFRLASPIQIAKAEFISQCDKAERLMDAVMTKMLTPSVPLYLLTLLQSIHASSSGDFHNTSLAEYYRYLLSTAFQEVGVKPDKLAEVFNYSIHLAWYFHKHTNGKTELSVSELKQFNKVFSEEWHSVDFDSRIEQLTKARVLIKTGDDYSFHYPYIYYYLKGQYISKNLDNASVKEHITHCCKHLYVRDYANTVLFVAHHTSDTFILDCINSSYKKLFSSDSPIKFDSDIQKINSFIQDAPELPYIDKPVEEHRDEKNKINDEVSHRRTDGLSDKEESSDKLSLIAQITMLFKSAEILGQVLKNQYSDIQRIKKRQYLEDLFNGPLRALANFYDFLEKSPDMLVTQIESEIAASNKSLSKENKRKIAQDIAIQIIQLFTFGFLMKAAEAASAETLIENVSEVVAHNNTNAFKLIELAIHLDSPKPIPRSKINSFLSKTKNEVLTTRILKMLIFNRLYMFKTSEKDMQWLESSDLKIDISKQHSINYIQKKGKMKK